jgi:hypothetical protein
VFFVIPKVGVVARRAVQAVTVNQNNVVSWKKKTIHVNNGFKRFESVCYVNADVKNGI